ncbi:hypothetical protein MRX96_019690 [Rhipicephalus microplus]
MVVRKATTHLHRRQGSASSAAPYTGPALRGPRGKASNSHQRQSRDAPTAANSGTVEEIRKRQCVQQRPLPQPDCDAQCMLRRALLDSLSLGYARRRRGPLQQETEATATRRYDRLSYELRVRAALMDSLCYPGDRKRG